VQANQPFRRSGGFVERESGEHRMAGLSGPGGLVLATPLSPGPSCLKTGGFASPPRGGFAFFSNAQSALVVCAHEGIYKTLVGSQTCPERETKTLSDEKLRRCRSVIRIRIFR